jgi:hypothetical protein
MDFKLYDTKDSLNLNKRIILEDIGYYRFGIASCILFVLSMFFYGGFHYLCKYKKVYNVLSKSIEFMRSLLVGFIIAVLFTDQYVDMIYSESFSSVTSFFSDNLPIILMPTICLIICLLISFRRRYTQKLNDEELFVSVIAIDDKKPNEKKSLLKRIKEYILDIIDEFNAHFAPLIYFTLMFLHAFFAGLGFNGHQYFGLVELIVVIHKILGIFRIKQFFDVLKCDKYISFCYILLFSIISPISILLRGYFSLLDDASNNYDVSGLCNSLFIQSLSVIIFIESLTPFPRSFIDLGLNWLTKSVTFICFYFYLKK